MYLSKLARLMKKRLGAALSAAAAFLVISTACGGPGVTASKTPKGGSAESVVPMGRYVETQWTIPSLPSGEAPGYIAEVYSEADGNAVVMYSPSAMRYRCYFSTDGKAWEEKDEAVLAALQVPRDEQAVAITRDAQGRYYQFSQNEAQPVRIRSAGDDLQAKELPVDWKDLDAASGSTLADIPALPSDMAVDKNGDLYLLFNEGVGRYAASGELLNWYPVRRCTQMALSDKSLLVYGTFAEELYLFDKESEALESIPLDAAMLTSQRGTVSAAFDEKGSLYFCSKAGIFYREKDGAAFEKIMDGAACTLGLPSLYLSSTGCFDGNIFINLGDGGSIEKLLEYQYDPDVPARPDKTLFVTALRESATLNQAAVQFQLGRSDVQVELRHIYDAGSAMTLADATRTLNTEILAGRGPDVLLLDDLPIESYIEKGVLLDLTGAMPPQTGQDALFPAMASSFQREGGLYAVPARFYPLLIAGTPENIQKASSLHALAQMALDEPGERILYNISPQALIKQFYPACAPAWVDSEKQIDKQMLTAFLEDIRILSQNTSGPDMQEDFLNACEEPQPSDAVAESLMRDLSTLRTAYGKARYAPFSMKSMNHFIDPYFIIKKLMGDGYPMENAQACLAPLPSQGEPSKNVFIPACILGINAQSTQKGLAEDFIRTALSAEVQASMLFDGMPVNQAAAVMQCQEQNSYFGSLSLPTGESLESEYPTLAAQKSFVSFFDSYDTACVVDETLLTMLLDESTGFFSGEKTADEAASAFIQTASAYLAE